MWRFSGSRFSVRRFTVLRLVTTGRQCSKVVDAQAACMGLFRVIISAIFHSRKTNDSRKGKAYAHANKHPGVEVVEEIPKAHSDKHTGGEGESGDFVLVHNTFGTKR